MMHNESLLLLKKNRGKGHYIKKRFFNVHFNGSSYSVIRR